MTCPCGRRDPHNETHCQAIEIALQRVILIAARYDVDEVAVLDLWAHARKFLGPTAAAQQVSDVLDLGWRPVVGCGWRP